MLSLSETSLFNRFLNTMSAYNLNQLLFALTNNSSYHFFGMSYLRGRFSILLVVF